KWARAAPLRGGLAVGNGFSLEPRLLEGLWRGDVRFRLSPLPRNGDARTRQRHIAARQNFSLLVQSIDAGAAEDQNIGAFTGLNACDQHRRRPPGDPPPPTLFFSD